MNEQKSSELTEELNKLDYQSVLQVLHEGEENILWKSTENKETLKKIVASPTSSLHSSFLAAEILRYYNVSLDTAYDTKLAKSYVYALEKTDMNADEFIGVSGNYWGFLYRNNDIGELGKQLISFGELAIPSLVKLLDVEGTVLYVGSQDAMIGNDYEYRIKDFAAFYISKIKDIPIKFYQDFEKRDAEIKRLQKIIEND